MNQPKYQMNEPEYQTAISTNRKVVPIICVFCNCCGLDAIDDFEDLGFCIKCKSYYIYDRERVNPQVEIELKTIKKSA